MTFRKGSHIVFTWPFLHFLTLQTAVAAKSLFQFKSDLEFKGVSHLGLHLGHPNFPRKNPLPKKKFFFIIFFVQPKAVNFQGWWILM